MQLPRLIGKGDEPGGILCQLDDLLVMLREKLDRDKILFQNIGRFSHHSTASEAHQSSSLPGFVNHPWRGFRMERGDSTFFPYWRAWASR